MPEAPSPNGSNGRDLAGRFAVGNPGGPGNPHASRVAALRAVLLDAVTDDDLRAIIAKLVTMAKGGDVAAGRELLDRLLGKPLTGVAVALEMAADNAGGPVEIHIRHDENWYGNDAQQRSREGN